MCNRRVKFELKIPYCLGKMSENFRGGGIFDSHCKLHIQVIEFFDERRENVGFVTTSRPTYPLTDEVWAVGSITKPVVRHLRSVCRDDIPLKFKTKLFPRK